MLSSSSIHLSLISLLSFHPFSPLLSLSLSSLHILYLYLSFLSSFSVSSFIYISLYTCSCVDYDGASTSLSLWYLPCGMSSSSLCGHNSLSSSSAAFHSISPPPCLCLCFLFFIASSLRLLLYANIAIRSACCEDV